MHRVMRPKDFDIKHLQLPSYMSPKLDGVRAFDDGNRFSFRSGNPIIGVDDLYHYAGSLGLDGEMLIPGIPFSKSAGLIRSHNPTPDAHLYVFDCTNYIDVFQKRYARLMHTHFYSNRIHIIEHTLVTTIEEVTELYNYYIEKGFEGGVVKSAYHQYQKKESWDWMRMVPVRSIDGVVISIYEGKGKYTGMLGGVVVKGQGVLVRVGTGFDDFQRMDYWNHSAKIMGKMIKVNYKERTKDGSLRHPSFDRIRHTKEAP